VIGPTTHDSACRNLNTIPKYHSNDKGNRTQTLYVNVFASEANRDNRNERRYTRTPKGQDGCANSDVDSEGEGKTNVSMSGAERTTGRLVRLSQTQTFDRHPTPTKRNIQTSSHHAWRQHECMIIVVFIDVHYYYCQKESRQTTHISFRKRKRRAQNHQLEPTTRQD